MSRKQAPRQAFNILIVGQSGRLQYEALLFAASLRHASPAFSGRLIVAMPRFGPAWNRNPEITNVQVLAALDRLGAEIRPFDAEVFGESYPHRATRSKPFLRCLPTRRLCFSTPIL
jgi:hypothetical protein